jgi:hypothetical protein
MALPASLAGNKTLAAHYAATEAYWKSAAGVKQKAQIVALQSQGISPTMASFVPGAVVAPAAATPATPLVGTVPQGTVTAPVPSAPIESTPSLTAQPTSSAAVSVPVSVLPSSSSVDTTGDWITGIPNLYLILGLGAAVVIYMMMTKKGR